MSINTPDIILLEINKHSTCHMSDDITIVNSMHKYTQQYGHGAKSTVHVYVHPLSKRGHMSI